MGKPKYYSSEYCNFFKIQKVAEKGQGDIILLYLSFLHVHRWTRHLFIQSQSCSAPMASLSEHNSNTIPQASHTGDKKHFLNAALISLSFWLAALSMVLSQRWAEFLHVAHTIYPQLSWGLPVICL